MIWKEKEKSMIGMLYTLLVEENGCGVSFWAAFRNQDPQNRKEVNAVNWKNILNNK